MAKQFAESHGWKWEEPLSISSRILTWKVVTNANWIGGNIHFKIRKRDGFLMGINYIKR